MSQALRRELRWALQQACTVEEVASIVQILLDGLREAADRYADRVEDRRKVLEADKHEQRIHEKVMVREAVRPNAEPPRYLNVQEAAMFLGLKQRTMDKWRVTGEGPPFVKIGRSVRYDRSDLQAYMAKRIRRSTSEEFMREKT